MSQPLFSQCLICKHRQAGVLVNGTMACSAFPQGIPPQVSGNSIAHNVRLTDLGQENDDVFTPDPAGGALGMVPDNDVEKEGGSENALE